MKNSKISGQPLRADAFGERFRKACDNSPHCPPKHQGRYTWIIQKYKDKTGVELTPETCRKWHEGETQARRDKVITLAQIFNVDPIWLETGQHSTSYARGADEVKRESLNSISVVIRPGQMVTIQNLPDDLSSIEAERIAKIVKAYVVSP
ncbi:MAG: hypothetical protein U0975_16755 [Erythrobacter sp.]|nr:hypothetical protein [Erythrobacter sp.]MDZ4274311.1 hypothetical protein [Erythrobacter sp.]